MSIAIVPFTTDHLDPAAALLAARHCRDRINQPALSPRYADPAATRPVLEELVAEAGCEGVAALCDDELVGYLMAPPVFSQPTETFAGFMPPRAVDIAYAGHAVAATATASASLYPRLYAALAARWLRRGIATHYVTIPADPAHAETWADLGFGRFIELGVRETRLPVAMPPGRADAITVRRAEANDTEVIQNLVTELWQSFADAPIFIPYLPETAAARRRLVAEHLADPGCHFLLAFLDEQVMGLQLFVEPSSPLFHISPLQTVEGSIYLFLATTRPEARSSGIGAALFAAGMRWAQNAGYAHCLVHYLTASRAATFWRGLGFQPVSHWMRRIVDERAIWATARSHF